MMKNFRRAIKRLPAFALLLLALDLSGFSQSKPIKDLQPTVILVSLDGFRSDYLDRYSPPNLMRLARDGVRARWMTPSFPSKTFPNHYAIATGLYPQNNGIVENSVYDRETRRLFTMGNRSEVRDGRWWLGEPIWVTAEKQGQRAAAFFWPGSEARIGGKRPTFWMPFEDSMPNDLRVDTVLSWLDLPACARPTFLTLYFSDVDNAGHRYGPDAAETKAAVLQVDRDLGRLLDGLKAREIDTKVNLIVVSDHGMAAVDPNHTIQLGKMIDTKLAEKILWTSEIVGIFPREGKEEIIYDTLKAKLPPQAKIYRKAEMPARFHYASGPRIPPLLVLPDEGWKLLNRPPTRKKGDKAEAEHGGGAHGYDNQLPSMRAIFIAHGEAIRRGKVVEAFENVQVYNLLCAILRLKPAPNDGNLDAAQTVLVDNRGPGR